jgi:Holliday junction resolvase
MNAKQKGNRFERQVAKQINKKFNTNVRRTPLSGGMNFKGDIICIDDNSIISEFSFECKNQEKLNIWKALEQSRNDAPQRTLPVVVFTKNFEREYIALEFEDFLNILKELEDLRNENT